jgi:hypothetical protein
MPDNRAGIAGMAREMAQSFVDMVGEQDEQIQPLLLAQMIAATDDEYLETPRRLPPRQELGESAEVTRRGAVLPVTAPLGTTALQSPRLR